MGNEYFLFHTAFPVDAAQAWRLAASGVETQPGGLERTAGAPVTMQRIWTTYREDIEYAAHTYSIPVEYILATIATESGGNPTARREEPGFLTEQQTPNRLSVGLTQTLLSTASEAVHHPVTAAWLTIPRNAILAGTAVIRRQATKTRLDGPKVFAAYNAGGVYLESGANNRWKLRQYPIGSGTHCDRAVKWLNDACAVTMAGTTTPRGWEWFVKGMRLDVIV